MAATLIKQNVATSFVFVVSRCSLLSRSITARVAVRHLRVRGGALARWRRSSRVDPGSQHHRGLALLRDVPLPPLCRRGDPRPASGSSSRSPGTDSARYHRARSAAAAARGVGGLRRNPATHRHAYVLELLACSLRRFSAAAGTSYWLHYLSSLPVAALPGIVAARGSFIRVLAWPRGAVIAWRTADVASPTARSRRSDRRRAAPQTPSSPSRQSTTPRAWTRPTRICRRSWPAPSTSAESPASAASWRAGGADRRAASRPYADAAARLDRLCDQGAPTPGRAVRHGVPCARTMRAGTPGADPRRRDRRLALHLDRPAPSLSLLRDQQRLCRARPKLSSSCRRLLRSESAEPGADQRQQRVASSRTRRPERTHPRRQVRDGCGSPSPLNEVHSSPPEARW